MIEQLGEFWRSQTTRLMVVYLAIIMAMSLAFSISIYLVTAEQLDRQSPGSAFVDETGEFALPDRLGAFLIQSVADAKEELVLWLYLLNLAVLVCGAAFSYVLARWTLDPIERNVAAQTRFVSDASHELRTPLTAIQTANEVALRRKKLTLKQARETLESNLEDVQRLQRLSSMLLQVAADDIRLSLQPVAVIKLVKQAISNTASDASARSVTVKHTIDAKLLVEADPDAAAQALTALVDNAVKYSPEGGVVAISAIKRRGNVVIRVNDHGSGIAKKDQKRIFERFYRTDQARGRSGVGGYGLGLEIAENIARHHGGSIELRSTPGRGSTFSLVLPVAR